MASKKLTKLFKLSVNTRKALFTPLTICVFAIASNANSEEVESKSSKQNLFEDITYGFSNVVYDVVRETKEVVVKPTDKFEEYSQGLAKVLKEAKPHIDVRYRYEFVSQDTKKEAKASSLSTKFGIETGKFKGLYAFLEGENISYLGAEAFNNTLNGKTKYATVPDPDTTEINQAFLGITTIPNTLLKVGRQTVDMGSRRFIGSQDWRQNETTYDAVVVQNSSLEDFIFSFSHIINQNNEFGDDSAQGDVDLNANAGELQYNGFKYSSITPYLYFIEDKDTQTNSNSTIGIILNGKNKIAKDTYIIHSVEYANQKDFASNSNNFNLDYYRLSAGVKWKGLTISGGREVLDGDGTTGLITILGANHGFNGWEDKFSTTPANGLEDTYVTLEYKFKDISKYINGIKMAAQYHSFKAENTGVKYGEEFDLKFSKQFFENYLFTVYYETYNADTFSKDTDKIIGELKFKF